MVLSLFFLVLTAFSGGFHVIQMLLGCQQLENHRLKIFFLQILQQLALGTTFGCGIMSWS